MSTIRRQSFDPCALPEPAIKNKPGFRFPVRSDRIKAHQGVNTVLGNHLKQLIDILIPTKDGSRVQIDGYQPVNEFEAITPYYSQEQTTSPSADLLDIYEPRLSYIRNAIESLLSIVEFEFEGKLASIDGFRLKHPEQWLSRGGGAIDILAHAGVQCNLNCRFCYNAGSPPAFQAKSGPVESRCEDMLARIDLYQPAQKLGLFPFTGSICEVLIHPQIKSILTALRLKTNELIRIPTNGSCLTDDMVDFLAENKPLFVDVSLNSAAPARRKWLMRDRNPQIALDSLARLERCGIPFSVVIVPWPFPSQMQMLADLKKTIEFSSSYNPSFIQISLPGYSRFFSEKKLFDHESVWQSITDVVLRLRQAVPCPIIIRPGLFEEYKDPDLVNTARPIGIVSNSPAAKANLRPGDRLLSVNGIAVNNRCQARTVLSMIQQSNLKKTDIAIERCGRLINASVDLEDFSYPFDYAVCPYLGLVFSSSGVPASWVEQLKQTIRMYHAQNILLMTSRLVAPTLHKHIMNHFFPFDVRIHLRIPENRYFGGNIVLGDLLTVDDFIADAMDYSETSQDFPDLIILPSSPFHLSGWGRDLTGKVYVEIERRLGIPVAMIECEPIFD